MTVDQKAADTATSDKVQLSSNFPIRKVTYGLIAGALTTIIVWLLSTYAKISIPTEVAAAVTTVLTVLVAYLTPLKKNEIVVASA